MVVVPQRQQAEEVAHTDRWWQPKVPASSIIDEPVLMYQVYYMYLHIEMNTSVAERDATYYSHK